MPYAVYLQPFTNPDTPYVYIGIIEVCFWFSSFGCFKLGENIGKDFTWYKVIGTLFFPPILIQFFELVMNGCRSWMISKKKT